MQDIQNSSASSFVVGIANLVSHLRHLKDSPTPPLRGRLSFVLYLNPWRTS